MNLAEQVQEIKVQLGVLENREELLGRAVDADRAKVFVEGHALPVESLFSDEAARYWISLRDIAKFLGR